MEGDCWNLTKGIESLSDRYKEVGRVFHPYLKKQISAQDRQEILEHLSNLLLHPELTLAIATTFSPLTLDLLERCISKTSRKDQLGLVHHERFCIAASKLLAHVSCVSRCLRRYLLSSPPLFHRLEVAQISQKKKKRKKTHRSTLPEVTEEELVCAAYRLVHFDRDLCIALWDWSPFMSYMTLESKVVQWYACNTVSLLEQMGEVTRRQLLSNHFTEEEMNMCARRMSEKAVGISQLSLSECSCQLLKTRSGSKGDIHIHSSDLVNTVISVGGVLLRKMEYDCQPPSPLHKVIPVASTRATLRSLALAVSSGAPILLEGPVGSGKTALVEHLAYITGRYKPTDLIKVQLGDQTDSKALVGTYRCTEIPGEFIWQAGALTQAVRAGSWILLEDLDYAPMDVVSVLLPLLESGSLTVPGHGDIIKAAPGFQIIATQRLYSHQGGLYRQQSAQSSVLDHCWTKVKVNTLLKQELAEVLKSLHPQLDSVVERLLKIFVLLSASYHGDSVTEEEEGDVGDQALQKKEWKTGTRMVSTRDLLKWCERISEGFDVKSSNTANRVFQEALDCFCGCIPSPEMRMKVAEVIGAHLNIMKEKAKFFCQAYKPLVDVQAKMVQVGRVTMLRKKLNTAQLQRQTQSKFSFTRHSLILLERIAACIERKEPVLLVGETGTGKTATVQYMSQLMGQRLKVINMNQQSDSTDLLGGYKPVDIRRLILPVREEFEQLFIKTFSRKQNVQFLHHVQMCYNQQRWTDLLKLMEHSMKAALERCKKQESDPSSLLPQWTQMFERLGQLKAQVEHADQALAFTFVEGTLVRALHDGYWILLDEINLANAETLECLSSLLEGPNSSLMLMEKGELEPVVRHPDFRLFACMNPATDVGKKELPPGIRNRFTEFYVEELVDIQDLKILVSDYLRGLALDALQIGNIVKFYMSVRDLAETKLLDGTGHRPHFSLRTLCRALSYAATNPMGSVPRSLYESFCLSFLTQLDKSSIPLVEQLVRKLILGKSNVKGVLGQKIPPPAKGRYTKVEGYWIGLGVDEPHNPRDYVITASVKSNLKTLARIVSAGRLPVLIQGETSVGKTSLIHYLAELTGNTCLRVNNHEHTDLQEYVGFYAADENGKLAFKEGVLVDAMRKGFWIILDELNLAPTDVLEALNRLLDDNRELFIPETQETISAHPGFMLFATQNPPGQYGGRKVLSRAFRNRFVELHFDEIPSRELETILHERCAIPHSYCQKMVAVMLELQLRRKGSGVFAGKQGFITLRDLFRWAERYHKSNAGQEGFYDWDQHIADEGYLLLAGKVRRAEERNVIQEVLQLKLRRTVNPEQLFSLHEKTSPVTKPILQQVVQSTLPPGFQHLVWTSSLRQLAVYVGQALKFNEPVLLVGETGCGKTTICQLFTELANQTLYAVNCHLHTETSDFLGGLRPVRNHNTDEEEEKRKLFEWCDGPLVLAMREGAPFLIDEISLADDSVLERLNSVLEPEQTLLLAEKGSSEKQDEVEKIVAGHGFRVMATMNPGGDYGKKELSPALRNRFTEIWCEQSDLKNDLIAIIEHNITEGIQLCNQEDCSSGIGKAMMEFLEWFRNNDAGRRCVVSIRDLLSWVTFINTCCAPSDSEAGRVIQKMDSAEAYIHGACMVFLDGIGSGSSQQAASSSSDARAVCLKFLHEQVYKISGQDIDISMLVVTSDMQPCNRVVSSDDSFGIPPFFIAKGPVKDCEVYQYTLEAPTTSLNAMRLLRGLQSQRAILLEGSPGVGKTSLVTALAKASGHEIIRINLSEQTDVTDLFGADLPVEGGEGGQFAWRDGPLLQALKAGQWIVLDELNLASQSVLEGLNACLDHRGEVFVPELSKTFQIQLEKTRIFACQNPLKQGGGRKGLPKSFLNRFTQVHVEPLSANDLMFIASTMYSRIPKHTLQKMVDFSQKLEEQTCVKHAFGQRGGPWEFNLRDLFRWCDLMMHDQGQGQTDASWDAGEHVRLIYGQRMRTQEDKRKVLELFDTVFEGEVAVYHSSRQFQITPSYVQAGHSFLARESCGDRDTISLQLLHHDLEPLEAIMKCVQLYWMSILVGPSACGKTSLVKLLATLTGHKLKILAMNSAMDTTELLGGFEQADFHRHLEELVRMTESLTTVLLQQLLTNRTLDISTAQQLQKSLSKLASFHLDDSQKVDIPSANVALFQKNLAELRQHLNLLRKAARKNSSDGITTDLEKLEKNLSKLEEQVCSDESQLLGGGGRFEWVDGLLVKALQKGDWLLIDNVNFCSPSVLDRLNGLLEPNGTLSINERGIIDGEIPTVVPHPDFRLFLAMDPKYGEISRAMRNRGVEIYILGQDGHGSYSNSDLRSMLLRVGLNTKDASQLINIHTTMAQSLYDTGGLPSMLLAASLTVDGVGTGLDISVAFHDACNDVYVCSQLLHSNQKKAAEILESVFKKNNDETVQVAMDTSSIEEANSTLICHEADEALMPGISGEIEEAHPSLPPVYSLCEDSVLGMVQRHGAAVKHILTNFELDENDVMATLRAALSSFLSKSSPSDWKLRCDWTSEELRGVKLDSMVGYEQILCKLFTSQLYLSVCEDMKKLNAWEEVKYLPFDLSTNPQLITFLSSSSDSPFHKYERMQMETDEHISHQRDIAQLLYATGLRMNLLLTKALSAGDNKITTSQFHRRSPLGFSEAFHQGQLTLDDLPHPSFIHLIGFLNAWNHLFNNWLNLKEPQVTEESVFKIKQVLCWVSRFRDLCREPIRSQEIFACGMIALHWSWVVRKTIFCVPQLLTGSTSLPLDFVALLSSLESSLSIPNAHLERLWKSVAHAMKTPLPFKSQDAAESTLDLQRICKLISLTHGHENIDIWKLLSHGTESYVSICRSIFKLLTRVWSLGDDEKGLLSTDQEKSSGKAGKIMLVEDSSVQDKMEVDTDACADFAELKDEIEKVRNEVTVLLKVKESKLLASDDNNDDDVGDGDDPTTKKHWVRASLLPVFDGISLQSKQIVLNKFQQRIMSNDGIDHKANVHQLLQTQMDFQLANSLTNPLHTLPIYDITANPSHDAFWLQLWSSFVSQMKDSVAFIPPSDWRSFLVESSGKLKRSHPSVLYTPYHSAQSFELISPTEVNQSPTSESRAKGHTSLSEISSSGVPLGCWEERLGQLREFSQVVWSNCGWMFSEAHSCSSVAIKSFSHSASHLLKAMSGMLLDSSKPEWLTMVSTLSEFMLAAAPTSDKENSVLEADASQMESSSSESKESIHPVIDKLCSLLEESVQELLGTNNLSSGRIDANFQTFLMMVKSVTRKLLNAVKILVVSGTEEKGELRMVAHHWWMYRIGSCWVLLGLLQTALMAPVGPVDPAQKTVVKLKYVQDEINELKAQLEVHDLEEHLLTGLNAENIPEGQRSNRIRLTEKRLTHLEKKEEKLKSRIAYRPHPSQYDSLKLDIGHYQESIGSWTTIEGTLQKANDILEHLKSGKMSKKLTNRAKSFLREAQTLRTSQDQFLVGLEERYPLYKDLWAGVTSGVQNMELGMGLVQHSIRATLERKSTDLADSFRDVNMESCVQSLTSFPFESSLNRSLHLTSEPYKHLCALLGTKNASKNAAHNPDVITKRMKASNLTLSLCHMLNHVKLTGAISPESRRQLHAVLEEFVSWWHQSEEARKQKEEEDASLFKYKTQTHGEDVKPEEEEERDLRKAFPSYEKDFADISEEQHLEVEVSNSETQDVSVDDSATLFQIDEETMQIVKAIHQRMYLTDDKTHPSGQGSTNVALNASLQTKCLELGYKSAVNLFGPILSNMDPSVDGGLIGSHLVMSFVKKSALSDQRFIQNPYASTGKPFDVYHDPSVSEVILCQPLLKELRGSVQKLLGEWPEHPTLQQICLLIDRIESFPVDSPLMKFVTGLEILLEKSQDWEQIAAKHVSLQVHLGKITQLVINWRKMELSFWSSSLDNVAYNHIHSTTKWWFHIYNVIQQQNETNDPHLEGEQAIESDTDAFLVTLQGYLEGATLGDYQARLEMVHAFYNQTVVKRIVGADDENSQTETEYKLWNLYRYYHQFVSGVKAELEKQRKPIEKELKEFVKISRWNDINFWAMKQAVAKSHKMVLKLCKKYKAILEEPAKSVFTETKMDQVTEPSAAPVSEIKEEDHESQWILTFDLSSALAPLPPVELLPELLHRLPSLNQKMKKHCRRIVKSSAFLFLASDVDEFAGEIVAAMKELQALDVTKDADKDKQKSEAKHIDLRKRKALAELFKQLKNMGLSYRKGLTLTHQISKNAIFNLPPVEAEEVRHSLAHISSSEEILTSVEKNLLRSEKYFFLNQARKAQLHVVMENPSQELGLGNIERCRGFAEHLASISLDQRGSIATTCSHIKTLSSAIGQLNKRNIHNTDQPIILPPQEKTISWLERLKQLLDECIHVSSQYQVLLESAPEVSANQKDGSIPISPFPKEWLSSLEHACKGDSNWVNLMEKFKRVECLMFSVKSKVDGRYKALCLADETSSVQLAFWSDFELLEDIQKKIHEAVNTFNEILQAFWSSELQEYGKMSLVLLKLKHKLDGAIQEFSDWKDDLDQNLKKELSNTDDQVPGAEKVEKALSAILLAVQNVIHISRGALAEEENEPPEQADDEDKMQSGQLTQHLGKHLDAEVSCLDMTQTTQLICGLLRDIKDTFSIYGSIKASNAFTSLVINVLPMMHKYASLCSFYLHQMISAHKATTKLLYILLGVFNELAVKGFCLPAEFSDELAGEGATKFEDIQGGGIGEGEGVKDVSDQIEDEDQVEDVKKQGEETSEEKQDDKDLQDEENGIEMSEDFEGKMHDQEKQEVKSDEEDDGADEDELDKQMGDVDQSEVDKLDEKLWGDEEDEDGNEETEKEQKEEEFGDGAGPETESELVAKDDNKGPMDEGDDRKDEKNEEEDKSGDEEEGPEKTNPKPQQPFDESEFNDDDVDPNKANDPPPAATPDELDLPDDLNLDGNQEENEESSEGEDEENPFEIETPMQDVKEDGAEEEEAGEEKDEDGKEDKDETEKMDEGAAEEVEGTQEEGKTSKEEEDQTDDNQKDEEPSDEPDNEGMENYLPDQSHNAPDVPQNAENRGKSSEQTEHVQSMETDATQEAGKGGDQEEEEEEKEKGTGQSETQQDKGHSDSVHSETTTSTAVQQEAASYKRKPGHSDQDRSLGREDKAMKRLRTVDGSSNDQDEPKSDQQEQMKSELYEHLKDASAHHDVHTLDTATEEQVKEASAEEHLKQGEGEEDDPVAMATEEEVNPALEDMETFEEKTSDQSLERKQVNAGSGEEPGNMAVAADDEPSPLIEEGEEEEEDLLREEEMNRESSIHTNTSQNMKPALPGSQHMVDTEVMEVVRKEIEQQLSLINDTPQTEDEIASAQKQWYEYESVTSSLARDLCEQLRLVLEPTQASKLKGDYRTGKRINMRKVIPYIASGFRKDKIWLRRTKPSKREYQILLAVDDSSSMADNRSKQMAFESVAMVSNALTWLEAGQLSICSFGESVKLLHSFGDQFSEQSGSRILQQFTFSQTKTKIAQLLQYATSIMNMAQQQRAPGSMSNIQTSQLLLVMSDGRGLFLEGMEKVKAAVRAARDANIFLVFLVLDNPENKDSILDIKVPIFRKTSELPDIQAYMEHFPFPFYILLRDINSLPSTLSDALRQWFELVTAGDC